MGGRVDVVVARPAIVHGVEPGAVVALTAHVELVEFPCTGPVPAHRYQARRPQRGVHRYRQ
jgi:hypothetical protein